MLEPILGVPISSTGMQYLNMGWALKVGGLRRSWGPFLKRPGKLTGPVSYFEIEISRKVRCVLTSN